MTEERENQLRAMGEGLRPDSGWWAVMLVCGFLYVVQMFVAATAVVKGDGWAAWLAKAGLALAGAGWFFSFTVADIPATDLMGYGGVLLYGACATLHLSESLVDVPKVRKQAMRLAAGWGGWAAFMATSSLLSTVNVDLGWLGLLGLPPLILLMRMNRTVADGLTAAAQQATLTRKARAWLTQKGFFEGADGTLAQDATRVRFEDHEGRVRVFVSTPGTRRLVDTTVGPGSGTTGDVVLDRFVAIDGPVTTALTTNHDVLLPAVNDHGARIEGGQVVAEWTAPPAAPPKESPWWAVGRYIGAFRPKPAPPHTPLPQVVDALLKLARRLDEEGD